jgi:hypothetical protein
MPISKRNMGYGTLRWSWLYLTLSHSLVESELRTPNFSFSSQWRRISKNISQLIKMELPTGKGRVQVRRKQGWEFSFCLWIGRHFMEHGHWQMATLMCQCLSWLYFNPPSWLALTPVRGLRSLALIQGCGLKLGGQSSHCKPSKETRNQFPAWRAGRPVARLHRLAESIPWNRFLGSLNVYKFGLRMISSNIKHG